MSKSKIIYILLGSILLAGSLFFVLKNDINILKEKNKLSSTQDVIAHTNQNRN